MSDLKDLGSCGLPDRWVLVNAQGELEGSDTDSNSSSIEVVEQETGSKPQDKLGHLDPVSQESSAECTELEKLMRNADAAAAEGRETDPTEPLTSGTVATAGEDVDCLFPHQQSVLKEPSGASYLRRESTGEEEQRKVAADQPPPGRTCHADQASQTDTTSSESSERRLSLSSLWSFSGKSSGADTTSNDTSCSASVDSNVGEHTSSDETDTEPEFVCLETEASTSCSQSMEGSVSRSGVKTRSASQSSVGSEFKFLSDFVQLSVSTDLPPHPSAAPRPSVQCSQHHHQQQQSDPRTMTPLEHRSSGERQLSLDLPEEEDFVTQERLEESGEVEPSALQDVQPVMLNERGPDFSDDAALRQRGLRRLSQPSFELFDENEEVSSTEPDLQCRDLSVPGNMPAMITEPRSTGHHPAWYRKHWLSGHLGLTLGAIFMLLLAFAVGHWLGMTWGQSRQLESQLSEMEQLQSVRDEHRQCMSQKNLIQQQADALKREQKHQQQTVTDLQGKHQQLEERLKEAERRVEQLSTANSQNLQDSGGDISKKGTPSVEKTSGSSSGKVKGRKLKKRRSGTTVEDSTHPREKQHDQERADIFHHLYFLLREERDIGINTSCYLHFLAESVNISRVLHYLEHYWNASKSLAGSMSNKSFWLSSASGLQESVVQTVSPAWRKMSSALSHTYHALAGKIFQSVKHQHTSDEAKGNKKGEENHKHEWTEDENDEEVYVEDEEEEARSHDEEADVVGHEWTDEEDDYLKTDEFDQTEIEDEKRSSTEDETHRGKKRRKTWTDILNKFYKKTQKALSRAKNRLQKTLHKVKDRSWRLWSEDSAISKLTARMKKTINKFSAKVHKKAKRWFKKHFTEQKHTETFHKHADEGRHATNEHKQKKSDRKHDGTNAGPDKVPENEDTNKQKVDRSSGNRNKHRSDQHGGDREREVVSGKFPKERKGRLSEEIGEDEQRELGKLGKSGNSDIHIMDKDEKNKFVEILDEDQRKGKDSNKLDKINVTETSGDGDKEAKKSDVNVIMENKRSETLGDNKTKKKKFNTGTEIKKEGRSDNLADSREEGKGSVNSSRKGHSRKTTNRPEKPESIGRTKFRLASQFQELFRKVNSVGKEGFKDWSSRQIFTMIEHILTVAQQYNRHRDLGLPASGSKWLNCQHAFWIRALSHHTHYEPTRKCLQFLADWQIALLQEKDGEDSVSMDGEVSEGDWNSFSYLDYNAMVDHDALFESEDDVDEDYPVYSDTDVDDLHHANNDKMIQQHPLPKGQREEQGSVNAPNKATQKPSAEYGQAWYIHRAQGRSNLRSEDHKADWMFERAMERDKARQQDHTADWVFERAADRDTSRQKKRQKN